MIMEFNMFDSRNRQRGFALILAIGFLAVLSILGAVVMDVATRDLSETVDVLPNQQALWAAERSIEYALSEDMRDELTLSTDKKIDLTETSHTNLINSTGSGQILDGEVKFLTTTKDLPAHVLEGQALGTEGRIYHVKVKTATKFSGRAYKETNVDATMVLLQPPVGGSNVGGTTGTGELL